MYSGLQIMESKESAKVSDKDGGSIKNKFVFMAAAVLNCEWWVREIEDGEEDIEWDNQDKSCHDKQKKDDEGKI